MALFAGIAACGKQAIAQSADFLDPFESVRFSFESTKSMRGSPIFTEEKVDYSWGEVERQGSACRSVIYSLYRNDPQKRDAYVFTTVESRSIEGGLLSRNSELALTIKDSELPKNVGDAKAIAESVSTDPKNTGQQFYAFTEKADAQFSILRGFSFLGMTPQGPIWLLPNEEKPSEQANGVVTFDRKSSGRAYKFTFSTNWGIFSQFQSEPTSSDKTQAKPQLLKDPFEPAEDPFAAAAKQADRVMFSGKVTDFKDSSFEMTSTTEQFISQRPQPITTDSTTVVSAFSLESIADASQLVQEPTNGTRIDLVDAPQIEAEWKDGNIVRTIDGGIVAVFDGAEFRQERRFPWLIFLNATFVFGVVIYIWLKRRSATGGLA